MNVDTLICTYGDWSWQKMSHEVAGPSLSGQYDGSSVRGIVRTVHNEKMTLAEVRNEAASMSDAEWLCFLDADDTLAPGYLEAMSAFYMQNAITRDWDALLAPYVSFNGSTPAIPNEGRWPELNVCVIGTLVRRDLFNAVGGFRGWSSCEDYDLWLRCVAEGAQICHVKDAIYRAQVNASGRNRDQSCVPEIRRQNASVFA